MGTKIPCDPRKGECLPTPFTKATTVWEPQTNCQLFELIRFDAFMVKYQDIYLIEKKRRMDNSPTTRYNTKSKIQ